MNINYENPTTLSISKIYEGTTQDSKNFMIIASWNDWDSWVVDSINWDGEEGTNEQESEITEIFLKEMNG